jgi:hypothetical protein
MMTCMIIGGINQNSLILHKVNQRNLIKFMYSMRRVNDIIFTVQWDNKKNITIG